MYMAKFKELSQLPQLKVTR